MLFPFSLVRAATEDSTRLVTFSTKAESLNHVLIKFKDQTGVEILFNRQLLGDQVCKELNLVKVSVDVALGKILEGTGFEFSKVDGVYIIKKKTKEKITRVEPRVVTGVVKDAQGEPLPGVTVVVKGTTLGCATDADGKYKLPISLEGDVVLVFSFVGMQTKEVTYKGEAELNITLEPDVTEIEQVVVTGIFTRKAESFTGAATTFKREDLKRLGNQNILQSLCTVIVGRPGKAVHIRFGHFHLSGQDALL